LILPFGRLRINFDSPQSQANGLVVISLRQAQTK
jgi:hypothetical protein